MRKNYPICLLVFIFVFLVCTCSAYAQETGKTDIRGTLSVSGTAVESFAPDTVTVILSVETRAKTAKEAAVENSKKAEQVVNKLKNMINTKAGDSIKTSSYSVQPVYEYNQIKKNNQLVGYRVINQITVISKQTNNAGNIIDAAIAAGANQVQNISFTLENNQEYCKIVLAKATQRAEAEAAVVAQNLGQKITGVKNVVANCGSIGGSPRYMKLASAGEFADAAAPSTPIEEGEVKIQGNVNIEFYIDNK